MGNKIWLFLHARNFGVGISFEISLRNRTETLATQASVR